MAKRPKDEPNLLNEIGYTVERTVPAYKLLPQPKVPEPIKEWCDACERRAHINEGGQALCTDCFLKSIRRLIHPDDPFELADAQLKEQHP